MARIEPEHLAPHDRESALFLERYESALEREKLCDRARVLALATAALKDSNRPPGPLSAGGLDVPLIHALESELALALCRTGRAPW